MSSVKRLLKNAKTALADSDWEYAIELSEEVLQEDDKNYFAYVFLGKANEGIRQNVKSKENYLKAIALDNSNVIAWKGLFVLFRNAQNLKEIVNFKEYFKLCAEFAQALAQQELSIIELINDIRVVRRKYPESEELFLESIRPGTEFGELIGSEIMTPREVLRKLLTLKHNSEQQRASKLTSTTRMKISVNDPDYHFKVNSSAWDVYKDSEVDQLFDQLINVTEDDKKRGDLETEWLEYRLKLLKTMPKDMKPSFFPMVREMVYNMITVNHSSLLAWTLYFDWKDYTNVNAMEIDVCLSFIHKFPAEPLAMVIYAWMCSSISAYDSKRLSSDIFKLSTNEVQVEPVGENGGDDEELDPENISSIVEVEDEGIAGLSEANVLEVLQENIVKCQQSILANRIISHYYVTQNEFQLAIPYIRTGTSVVAYTMRDLGAWLKNSKFDFTLLYATTYTYFEAPKNHNIALSLFDKVLLEEPKNAEAKMGKGLIYIEMKKWDEASKFLKDAVAEFPNNLEIVSAYGWSLLYIGETQQAIANFRQALENSPSNDSKAIEFRALNCWRIAKALLHDVQNREDEELITEAYQTLIRALKISDTYAPAYSLLGFIYNNYYTDESRAFKCFFKALSLDSSDIEAAYYISEKYCEKGNWEAASSVCERLVKVEYIKNTLQSINWPFRVLGMSCLERQLYPESIEWFQSSIRVAPSDVESWVGLGQAYLNCGRVEASIKVFEKVLNLDDSHGFAWCFLANALSALGEFERSVQIFEKLVNTENPEECFLASEISTLVDYATELYTRGYLLKAIDISNKTIAKIEYVVCSVSANLQNVWISLSKALRIFVIVESEIDKLPIDSLVNIFNAVSMVSQDPTVTLDNISLDSILVDELADNISIALKFVVLSAKYPIVMESFETASKTVRAALWYNLGCARLLVFLTIHNEKYCNFAIQAFKNAISCQSNSTASWIGLGIATMNASYQVSQHCFIKAIALNARETVSWYCLAMLALTNNDTELARDIFMKAQSISPEDSYSWLGLALISEKEGLVEDSSKLFAHAHVLANGKSKVAQLLYAKDILSRSVGGGDDERDVVVQQELSSAAFGLSQYLKKSQNDVFATQLSILALERLHYFKTAISLAQHLSTLIEERFEKSQNENELFNFALVKTQLARLYLGNADYVNATETATFALSIIEDDENSSDIAKTAIISNNVVLGLSSFFNSDIDKALDHSNILLSMSHESSTVAILIFQILYSMKSEEASNIALQELLDYVDSHGSDYNITLILAAFFILEDRPEELAQLAKELKMASPSLLIKDQHKDIPFLLQEINKRLGNQKRIVPIWQKASFFFPNSPKVWDKLSSEIAFRVSSSGQNRVTASHLSKKLINCGSLAKIQKAMFLCPWDAEAVNALRECF
ncbi:unnamed protein product [Kluyveromyces dobzhanskii CBS 2104]|uniref:WGS project CCBQ000000000 data, contig 00016 n=1 Tax=Kluyveromyces dobzhanskii CBS 2104 TaxID=1427455 RepID=A0A0A8L010_9SACH|nr:unnamed protein product [Kluyveromyces dobzhanskii CBS 2104]